jgi:hypothetical protein
MSSFHGHPTPIAWTNQNLVVYHGTNDLHAPTVLQAVRVAAGRAATDFGRGFYTTTNFWQANSWGQRSAAMSRGSLPVVIRFDLNRDAVATLHSLFFIRGDARWQDYWSFAGYCRARNPDHGRVVNGGMFDIVAGPVMKNISRREIFEGFDQISFHTPASEALLNRSNPTIV